MATATLVRVEQDEAGMALSKRYAETRSPELRERLILQYQPLVKYVVRRLGYPTDSVMDYDDLVSHGTIGLIEAVERFDPERGTPFKAYAVARIKGAVLDALRDLDRLPRTLRQKVREADRTAARLTSELGRPPEEREIACALGVQADTYRRYVADASRVTVSLDAMTHGDAEEDRGEFGIADPDATPVDGNIERKELRTEVARAIRQLPQRDQLLLGLYYKDGLSMREVGDVLGVTESRVSQLCTRAVARLAEVFEARLEQAA
jgi:RNA polymerase sigma factor for flagellar operon FliA